jgi:hypothetical protein
MNQLLAYDASDSSDIDDRTGAANTVAAAAPETEAKRRRVDDAEPATSVLPFKEQLTVLVRKLLATEAQADDDDYVAVRMALFEGVTLLVAAHSAECASVVDVIETVLTSASAIGGVLIVQLIDGIVRACAGPFAARFAPLLSKRFAYVYARADSDARTLLHLLAQGWRGTSFPTAMVDQILAFVAEQEDRRSAGTASTSTASTAAAVGPTAAAVAAPPTCHLDALLPPRPLDAPDPAVSQRVALYLSKAKDGLNFNAHLRSLKSFRNPSILAKLVTKFSIDEHGTAYAPSVWNPQQFDDVPKYDELAKIIKQSAVDRSSAATGKVEFTAAAAADSSDSKRPALSEHAKKLAKKEKYRQQAISARNEASQPQQQQGQKRSWF